jgi:hypothetical protein
LIARNHCIEERQFDGVAVWSKSGVVVLVYYALLWSIVHLEPRGDSMWQDFLLLWFCRGFQDQLFTFIA